MRPALNDELRVRHVLDAIAEVRSYLNGVALQAFLSNSEKRFACIKQLEIIGEACTRITPDVKEKYPEVEWKNIISFRNISIHEYFGVNFNLVWQIAQNDLPVLKQQFSKILVEFQNDKSGKSYL